MSIESISVASDHDNFRQEKHTTPETLEGKSDRHLIRDTLELLDRPELFLGEGAIGRVFAYSPRDRRFCQKVCLVRDVAAKNESVLPERYRKDFRGQAARKAERPWTNGPKMEAHLTNMAAAVSDESVRVPTVYRTMHISGSEEGEGYMVREEYDVLLMEQVDGCNLDQLAERGLPLPDGFDPDRFADDLLRFVKKMNDRGIYHRDIAPRNVMIDFKTGKPWLIDFGRGTTAANDPYTEEFTKEGRPAVLRFDKTDEDNVEGVRAHLKAYHAYRQMLDNKDKTK